uniref:Uncharacterized protein n=1 Tax=Nothoprocta perdicaria TaxID=30464 RepID=A0A8C6ZPA5_NOTPE
VREAPGGASRRARSKMEAEARRRRQEPLEGAQQPAVSYWLDLWLFVLFDLALLVFVYLLP